MKAKRKVRGNGYDFDARWDDGLVNHQDKRLYDLLMEHGSCPEPELRRLGKNLCTSAYNTDPAESYEKMISRLVQKLGEQARPKWRD